MSDTSVRGSSVPQAKKMTVKRTIAEACAGFPIVERDFTVVMSSEITAVEVAGLLSALWFAEQRVLVRVRFKQGDVWNQLKQPGFKALRKVVMGMLRDRLDDDQYQRTLRRLNNYAWVARKWDEEKRHDHKAWSFFVENVPDDAVKTPMPENRILLRITGRYVRDGVEYIECCGRSDREYVAVALPTEIDGDAG